MAKYLITGGCGFIGSCLAHALCKLGFSLRILDNLSTGKRENAPPEAELIVGDIRDKKILKEAVEGVDGCFHLAAIASMEKSILALSDTHEVNLLGTVRLLEAIIETGRKIPIVYTSSAAVYGNCPEMPLKETLLPNPLSPYGVDKWSGEKHLAVVWHLYQIPSFSFRLFNVYGPGQNPHSPYSGVISIFSENIRRGERLRIYGSGDQKRDFIYVEDVVAFLMQPILRQLQGCHLFNLSRGVAVSIKELGEILEKISGKKVEREYLASRKGDILLSLGDPNLAETFFQMRAKVPLEQGLTKLLEQR